MQKCDDWVATGSDRGSRGGLRSPSAVDEAIEEEPEDTLNEGASSEGVWFAPCVCACISHCLDSSSVDEGMRQQTGFEGLKEVQRWRCSNGSKGEVALAVYQI